MNGAWDRAVLALTLLAIDPTGLRGFVVRSRVSPAQDALLNASAALPLPRVQLHPHMTAQTLDGDIDVSATLGGGALVMQKGMLQRGASLLVLPMAERASPYLAARLSKALDDDHGHVLLALDEGAEEDEVTHVGLADRCAFWASLDGLALADLTAPNLPADTAGLSKAARLVTIPDDVTEQLVRLAVGLGIDSLRAPTFALRAAQAHAALSGRSAIAEDDLTAAVALVFAHRATQLPAEQPEEDTDDRPREPDAQDQTPQPEDELSLPDDMLLDAVKAALPPDLLAGLAAGAAKGRTGAGSGAKRNGSRRGRPLPARSGGKSAGARVDLIASLRAAVPWQTLRKRAAAKAGAPPKDGPIIRATDLRHKRYETLSDRLLIFAVDASGSAAMARLAEAKGAVEMLLGEAYARRDHVALISFRGTDAEVLLPPTRSLVQTKRRLAALPGGGATPLASGLTAAMTMAQGAARKGMTPTVIVLTDGRANVALDGHPNRIQAAEDAQSVAQAIAAMNIDALIIDTTIRPERSLKALAETMNACYLALPRADAKSLSAAVTASLAD